MKPSDTLGGNLGFSPNGGLRGRNSMRSGAKGGAQGWTVLLARRETYSHRGIILPKLGPLDAEFGMLAKSVRRVLDLCGTAEAQE